MPRARPFRCNSATAAAFCNNRDLQRRRPMGPSRALNLVGALSGRVLADAMTEAEIEDVTAAFVAAARLAREAGFDAVELHLGHGYLLSQFLSPGTQCAPRSVRWISGKPRALRAVRGRAGAGGFTAGDARLGQGQPTRRIPRRFGTRRERAGGALAGGTRRRRAGAVGRVRQPQPLLPVSRRAAAASDDRGGERAGRRSWHWLSSARP